MQDSIYDMTFAGPTMFLLAVAYTECLPKQVKCPFVGHRQTVQTQIRHHKTWRLTRVSTVCLQNGILKSE